MINWNLSTRIHFPSKDLQVTFQLQLSLTAISWALIVCGSMRSPDPGNRGEPVMTNKWLHLSSSVSWSLPKTSSVHTVASRFTLHSWFPLRRGSSLCPICSTLHHLCHYLPQTAQKKMALPSFNSPDSWVPPELLMARKQSIWDLWSISCKPYRISSFSAWPYN